MARNRRGDTSPDPETAARLKSARESAGLTQEQAADRLHVSPSTIGNWENARTEPTAGELRSLCRLYSVTSAHLLGEAAA